MAGHGSLAACTDRMMSTVCTVGSTVAVGVGVAVGVDAAVTWAGSVALRTAPVSSNAVKVAVRVRGRSDAAGVSVQLLEPVSPQCIEVGIAIPGLPDMPILRPVIVPCPRFLYHRQNLTGVPGAIEVLSVPRYGSARSNVAGHGSLAGCDDRMTSILAVLGTGGGVGVAVGTLGVAVAVAVGVAVAVAVGVAVAVAVGVGVGVGVGEFI